MSVAFILCGFVVGSICVYLVAGDHFPGRSSEKSFLPSSYSGILRSTSSKHVLSSTPWAVNGNCECSIFGNNDAGDLVTNNATTLAKVRLFSVYHTSLFILG